MALTGKTMEPSDGEYTELPPAIPGVEAPHHLALAALGMSGHDDLIFEAAMLMTAPADPVQALLLQLSQRLQAVEGELADLRERLLWKKT